MEHWELKQYWMALHLQHKRIISNLLSWTNLEQTSAKLEQTFKKTFIKSGQVCSNWPSISHLLQG